MKRKIFPVILLGSFLALTLVFFFCNRIKGDVINGSNIVEIISVPVDYDNILPSDSLISDFKFVPLETNENCLISHISGLAFLNNRFYILDRNAQQILVFDTSGHFINKVNSIGRGPGEYAEIRDFKIDHEGNIYILSFNKILVFSARGSFLKQIDFNFLENETDAFNPIQFALAGDEGFYFWRGSFGFKKEYQDNYYALYRTNKRLKIINKYFPLKGPIFGGLNMFYGEEGNYSMQALIGNDTIYKIGKNGLSAGYFIDFGGKKLPEEFIRSKGSESRFYSEVLTTTDYSMNIDNIFETSRFVYFLFANGMHWRNVLYSKNSKKALAGTVNSMVSSPVLCTYNNSFVSSIVKVKSAGDIPAGSETERKIKEYLKSVGEMDNPVLFIYSLKDF